MKFRNYYILLLLFFIFSCRKNEEFPAIKISHVADRIFYVEMYENDIKVGLNLDSRSMVLRDVESRSHVRLTINDTTGVLAVHWIINNVKYTSKEVELDSLIVGYYKVEANILVFENAKYVLKHAILGTDDRYPRLQEGFNVYYKPEAKDYPYFAEPYGYNQYIETTHANTLTTLTYKTIVNYEQTLTGEQMNRITHYQFFCITIPSNETIGIQQYNFTTKPGKQPGVWLEKNERGNYEQESYTINLIKNWLTQYQYTEYEFLPFQQQPKTPSSDNFFNVTAIITEDGVKKIVGDYKYNDDIKGKFKLRIE